MSQFAVAKTRGANNAVDLKAPIFISSFICTMGVVPRQYTGEFPDEPILN